MNVTLVSWKKEKIKVEHDDADFTVGQLKRKLSELTRVEHPKLLNLKTASGSMASDESRLSELKKNSKFLMLGTASATVKAASAMEQEQLAKQSEIADDLDIDDFGAAFETPPHQQEVYLAKVQKRIDSYPLELFEKPREGKKLLVLDIDYTLIDHRSTVSRPIEMMRPFLHDFLASAYRHYDIIIWSATNMKWIELKMAEMGVYGNEKYKILAYVDSKAMIDVISMKRGLVRVKPLPVLWNHEKLANSGFGPSNTIMFDDLRRNFLMNPQNGLRIRAFRDAPLNRGSDRALMYLSQYLSAIAKLDSFESLDHSQWKAYLEDHLNDVETEAKFS